ncbi:hypothetical protein AWZ03_015121 [Drosophila navojoa]|uniref:Reverse transcriptase RNase H-like domain-containing protein n=1 Tax=Drosophila navojoa TaxID=7232 RepID=A0A484AN36_DRONA|nr:hypothetical protein AWZ03_015121 [Drosophila navojoa]
MRCYLEGYRFDVVTDHLALKWLNSIESLTGRIARWRLELQKYQFDIRYRRGSINVVADALSRQPLGSCQQAVEDDLPCGWIKRMRERIAKEPEKFQVYVEENGQLYRNLGHRIDEEDFIPWKLCSHGCTSRSEEDGSATCAEVLLAGHVSRRRQIREALRNVPEIQMRATKDGRAYAQQAGSGANGGLVRRFRGTITSFQAWKHNVVAVERGGRIRGEIGAQIRRPA